MQLKDFCRERGLKVGGNKGVLIARLEEHETVLPGVSSVSAAQNDDEHAPSPVLAEQDACELQDSFESAVCGEDGGDDKEDNRSSNRNHKSDEDEDPKGDDDRGSVPAATVPVSSAKAWIDEYILHTCRKSGRQTEKSVLSLWKQWVPGAIAAGIIPDIIVDANHSMAYLKYAATRQLLTTMGQDQDNRQQLSLASLKKVMTMLGRVRCCQVDDDRTLKISRPASSNCSSEFYKALMVEAQRLQLEDADFDLFPEHFEQVTKSILTGLDQFFTVLTGLAMSVPSIIKAHFSWTWQCTTLNHGDELVNLLLSCLQPFQLCVPEHMPINGCRPGLGCYFFGVLSLYHETKVPKPGKCEPDYNFVLPHCEPLQCSIGALAILLHFVFDQEGLVAKTPGWDWSCPSTWRMIRLMFGKTVGKPCSPDTL
ncbi:hypothetical protein V8E53_015268 [Lactarius tabidus]